MPRLVDLTTPDVRDELLIVGEEKLSHHVGRDERSMVVANIFREKEFVDCDMFLMPCDDSVGQFEPSFHA